MNPLVVFGGLGVILLLLANKSGSSSPPSNNPNEEPGPGPKGPDQPNPDPKPDPNPNDKIDNNPKPEPKPDEPKLPEIKPTPTPGHFYQIKYGDVLFDVSNRAYNTPKGTNMNYNAAKRINQDPYNAKFVRPAPKGEEGLFPNGRISFMPVFGPFDLQYTRGDGAVGLGQQYAVIFIPV